MGFAEFELNGHIDCCYVHHEFQGSGVGSALIHEIEKKAVDKSISRVYAEVSITAKPFFEAKGVHVVKQQTVTIRDVELINFIMEKRYQSLRLLSVDDIPILVEAFNTIGWSKPSLLFEQYLKESEAGARLIWVVFIHDRFAGYITLKSQSQYESFARNHIPEIMDLNVLPSFRKTGVGSMLLDIAEKEAATKSDLVGIGVGLYAGHDGGMVALKDFMSNAATYLMAGALLTITNPLSPETATHSMMTWCFGLRRNYDERFMTVPYKLKNSRVNQEIGTGYQPYQRLVANTQS